jgi:hypothetical protein
MKNTLTIAAVAFGMLMVTAPAFAQVRAVVPEPMSLSLLAGGVAVIAAVKRSHRK